MSSNSGADEELQKESEASAPIKTLTRLALTVRNPIKAMRRIAYDPDLLILLVMFMLFGVYSLPAAFVQVSKIEIPDDIMLYNSPDEAIAYGAAFTRMSSFRTDAAKLYWGEILIYNIMIVIFATLVLIVGARLLMGSFRYKEILSGVAYSSIVLLIVGVVQTGLILAIPGVTIPYHTEGNLTYISWPEDLITITGAKTFNVKVNLTAPGAAETCELWDLNLSTALFQAGETAPVGFVELRGSSKAGSTVADFGNGTSVMVGPGSSLRFSAPGVNFQVQDGKTYVTVLNGSLVELKQDAIIGFELHVGTNREKSAMSNMTWPGTRSIQTWVMLRPELVTVLRNVSTPTGITGQVTYGYWDITADAKGDGSVVIQANMTLPYQAQTDRSMVGWAAESVLAQQMSVATYFSRGMTEEMQQPTTKYAFLAVWAISRAWQSVVLMCLLRSSYEDMSWLRAAVLVAIQQFLAYELGF